ncbi:MAG TPA: biotin/lipoyl-binding protein, partial [Blastocatellia bacterium]|nr:biotin/lipoyl-binding protein [Blastocatellia bacterium]
MKDKKTVGRIPEPAERAAPPVAAAAPKTAGVRRILIPLILLAVIATGGFLIWKRFFAVPPVPPNLVVLSGRIEGDDSAIAPKTGGRIIEVRVREGDSVKTGDTIATLDDQQIKAREEQARAALLQAEARAKSARDQIAVLQEELRQNRLQIEQAKIDAAGRVSQAEAEVAAAEAAHAQQQAAYQIALFDEEAYTRLAKTGAVSERQGKQASSTAAQQAAAVAAAKKRIEAARGALTMAQANL